jgi:nitroimidazol reductase NimA-like FMN-containing flavoprotein (pyridoxamine 5'-phosphate oxidase superfamily)
MASKTKRTQEPKAARPEIPGYGLPKGKKGLLAWKWADTRLRKSHNYWVATSRPDGRPHVMVVWGLWRDGAFYFCTGETSRKARNLAANPYCVVCTELAEQAVIVEGTVELVTDPDKHKSFGKLYEKKYKWDMEGFTEPVYVVRPRVAFGLWEKKFVNTATRWQFQER